jgi:hypothetical protein
LVEPTSATLLVVTVERWLDVYGERKVGDLDRDAVAILCQPAEVGRRIVHGVVGKEKLHCCVVFMWFGCM